MNVEGTKQDRSIPNVALLYRQRGCSVIPIKRDKRPYISWTEFQKRLPELDEIKDWWQKWPSANVGIVTGRISGLVVIDIDTEEGFRAIQEYLADSLEVPRVKTPGGGQHLYFKCPGNPPGNNARIVPGCDFRGEGGYVIAPPSRNGANQCYEWQKGLSLFEIKPPPLPSKYLTYINNAIAYRENDDNFDDTATEMFTQGRRDEDLFHVANCLVKGGMRKGEAFQLLNILAKTCRPPFPPQDVQVKIESAFKRAEKRERNLAQEVDDWILTSNGLFLSSDVAKDLQLSSREDRKNLSKILARRCDDGALERSGNKNGCFRRVIREIEKMDFLNAPAETVDIKLPFNIHEKVEIMPGNIILIMGEVNSGKTAFCLNIIKENMRKFEIHYFNSEMGGSELKKRLLKFNDIQLNDWNFEGIEQSDNFADVVKPGRGKINIIDFLEIYKDFYEIGGRIAEIHKKLKGAIAIIAIQKNKGLDVGLGGYRSLEKPRLALAMSPGKLKIVKAKNWRTQENPNGLQVDFKLVQGCVLIQDGSWHYT